LPADKVRHADLREGCIVGVMKSYNTPEPATGDVKLAGDIIDKRGYAQRWRGSPRWVDTLLARGLPHLKIGNRRVRILIPEADAWMREQFGTQRRSKITGNSGQQQQDGQ